MNAYEVIPSKVWQRDDGAKAGLCRKAHAQLLIGGCVNVERAPLPIGLPPALPASRPRRLLR